MRNEKIIQTWNQLTPDDLCKRRILNNILSANSKKTQNYLLQKCKRCAVTCLTIICILFASVGTVYATNTPFRNFVNSLLFPKYTTNEFISIENGHLTSSFDAQDILLTFLDKFNQKEFGNNITVLNDNGYRYNLYNAGQSEIQAFVTSSVDDYQIIVSMTKKDYNDISNVWQITGYEIVTNNEAATRKTNLTPYTDEFFNKSQTPIANTSITATKNEILIYNVNDKENIVNLSTTDSEVLMKILEGCEMSNTINGNIFTYVVKKESISYMFDANGNGLIDYGEEKSGFSISSEDLSTIMNLFKTNNISIE